MHPALSVVFFTTASGAGYGLLALLGVLAPFGFLPEDQWFGAGSLGLALTLVTTGLLSSALHLSHPERAWRAFSQWRSSWLSREGVLSLLTYLPAGLFAMGWVVLGRLDGWVALAGLASAVCAVATVTATGMIYASLKPVAQWHSFYTAPGYLIFSLMTGATLLVLLVTTSGASRTACGILALVALAAGWGWKIATWRHDDRLGAAVTLGGATGLGGAVRSVEWPHTEENFVLKETGYRIARKHAAKLRRIVHVCAFAVPLAAMAAALLLPGVPATVAALVAVLALMPGMLAERWLFFAEARHTAAIYYGR